MAVKDSGKKKVYSFCFHFEDVNVWDERVTVGLRSELTDYSEYLDAWDLLKQAL